MNETVGVFGVNLGNLWGLSDKVGAWSQRLIGYYEDGDIRPVIAKQFPLEAAADAHRFIESRQNIGKVILTP